MAPSGPIIPGAAAAGNGESARGAGAESGARSKPLHAGTIESIIASLNPDSPASITWRRLARIETFKERPAGNAPRGLRGSARAGGSAFRAGRRHRTAQFPSRDHPRPVARPTPPGSPGRGVERAYAGPGQGHPVPARGAQPDDPGPHRQRQDRRLPAAHAGALDIRRPTARRWSWCPPANWPARLAEAGEAAGGGTGVRARRSTAAWATARSSRAAARGRTWWWARPGACSTTCSSGAFARPAEHADLRRSRPHALDGLLSRHGEDAPPTCPRGRCTPACSRPPSPSRVIAHGPGIHRQAGVPQPEPGTTSTSPTPSTSSTSARHGQGRAVWCA